MSCSRTQHGGGRFRTPDLSLRSPTLYHWATALPLKIRHTCKSRLARFECEYWWKCQRAQKDIHVRLKQIELALFTLCDGSFVFGDVTAEISAQVIVRRQITRSICRIDPVVGIGLPVRSTLIVSPTVWAAALQNKQNDLCAQRRLR